MNDARGEYHRHRTVDRVELELLQAADEERCGAGDEAAFVAQVQHVQADSRCCCCQQSIGGIDPGKLPPIAHAEVGSGLEQFHVSREGNAGASSGPCSSVHLTHISDSRTQDSDGPLT